MGGEPRIPIVLDEPAGLSLKTEKRLGMFFFLFFMLSLPSQSPILLHDEWQSPLIFEFGEIEAASRGDDGVWMTNLTIEIINPSFVQHSYAIDVVRDGGQSIGEWDYEWDCKGEDSLSINGLGCGEDLMPGKYATFVLSISWNKPLYSPMGENFSLIMLTEEGYQLQSLQVLPALEFYPTSDWNLIEDNGKVKRCIRLNGDLGTEDSLLVGFPNANTAFTTETRLYWIEGQTDMDANLSEIPDEICVIGLDPIILRAWDLNQISLNGVIFEGTMPAKPLKAIVPLEGWNIFAEDVQGYGAEFATGGLLAQGDQCPIDSHISTPPSPSEGDWIWDMSVRKEGQIPAIVNETNLTLMMEEGVNVSLCQNQLNPNPQISFAVEQGPELILVRSNISYRLWSNIWAAATNGTLISSDNMSTFSFYNPSNTSIPVRVENEGSGTPWQMMNSSTSLEQGINEFSDSHISTPPSPSEGDWIWDMSVRKEGQIPAIVNETNLTLMMEEGVNVSLCQNQLNPNPQISFAVEQGPELILVRSNISYRLWSNIWAAATNGTLISSDNMSTFSFYNPSNTSIPVRVENEGSGTPWQMMNSSTSLEQGINEFSFMPSNSTFSTMWISHQDGGVVIHLGSYI